MSPPELPIPKTVCVPRFYVMEFTYLERISFRDVHQEVLKQALGANLHAEKANYLQIIVNYGQNWPIRTVKFRVTT